MSYPEKITLVNDPTEMRKEILRLRRHDSLVDRVMTMADRQGLNAEDRYVVLAYYALLERQKLSEITLADAIHRMYPNTFPKGMK